MLLAIVVFSVFAPQATASEPAWSRIEVQTMHCAGCAKRIAARLYTVRGVKEVRVELSKKTLYVAPQNNVVLSPKAMWEAVVKAKDLPVRLAGPSGTFTEKPTF